MTEKTVSTIVGHAMEDINEDLSQETQGIVKDLKTKITSHRCVELIQEHVGDPFAKEKSSVKGKLDHIEQQKVSISQVHEMLRDKADVSVLQTKADRSTLIEMFEFVNSKIGIETSDDVVKKKIRTISNRLDEIQRTKLDKSNPQLMAIFTMVSGNGDQLFQTPAAPAISKGQKGIFGGNNTMPASLGRRESIGAFGSGNLSQTTETCLSCSNQTPEPSNIETVVDNRELEKQQAQDQLHIRQMTQSTNREIIHRKDKRILQPPIDINEYITNMTSSHPAITPAPPASTTPSVSGSGIDPRRYIGNT